MASPLTQLSDDQLVALMQEHGTLVALSRHLGIGDNQIHHHIRRVERERPEANLKRRLAGARRLSAAKSVDTSRHDWPADDVLAETIRNAPTIAAAAMSLGVEESSLRARCRSRKLDVKALRAQEKITVKGSRVTIEASELRSAAEMCKRRGIKISDYRIERIKVNEWGRDPSTDEPYAQLTATLVEKPNLEWIFPAVVPDPVRPKPKLRKATETKPQLVVLVGDHQAPYHSEGAHQAFLRFCEQVKPDRGVHVGDLIDLPSISRHADSAVYNASVQDCINEGHRILREIVLASPKTTWEYLVGNHDQRVRTELLNRAERMFGIRPADIPGAEKEHDALSLRRLLRLDDLHVTLVDNQAGFAHNEVRLTPSFAVRHGWLTGQNPVKRSMEVLNSSVAVGHTHAKRSHWRTLYDHEGTPTVHQGVELGTMSQTGSGIGFSVRPDWQPGWCTVAVWPDGQTQICHANYNEAKGEVLWRGQRF